MQNCTLRRLVVVLAAVGVLICTPAADAANPLILSLRYRVDTVEMTNNLSLDATHYIQGYASSVARERPGTYILSAAAWDTVIAASYSVGSLRTFDELPVYADPGDWYRIHSMSVDCTTSPVVQAICEDFGTHEFDPATANPTIGYKYSDAGAYSPALAFPGNPVAQSAFGGAWCTTCPGFYPRDPIYSAGTTTPPPNSVDAQGDLVADTPPPAGTPPTGVALTGDSLTMVQDIRSGVFYLVGALAGLLFFGMFWYTFGRNV